MASEYWDSVRSIAEEIREEYPDADADHNERMDRVHEDVDGSSFIIYYAENEVVLRETKNEPDAGEIAAMSDPKQGWKHMRAVAAYLAMEMDVHSELRRLDDEAEEEEEEE